MAIPIVAIVGRPNVGKSALFNRLAGRRIAIVSDLPGTTRDRISTDAAWEDRRFILVDTGGVDPGQRRATEDLDSAVQEQTAQALRDADVAVLVVDVVDGVTNGDRDAAELVRRSGKPVVLAANKADNETRAETAVDFYALGLGDPHAISAYHGHGVRGMMQAVAEAAPAPPGDETAGREVRIAIAGRPNVGKSALFNAVTGAERSIVNAVPGTTRDPVDGRYRYRDREVLFVDTAGLRRRGKAPPGIEKYSALRTIRAIERAHVVLLLLDATEFVTAQDTHVAGFIEEASRGAVIVVNKWDLAGSGDSEMDEDSSLREVRDRLKFLEGAPVRFTSATQGKGIRGVLDSALVVFEQWTRRVDSGELNRVVMAAMAAHPPPSRGRAEVRIYGVEQSGTAPPVFSFHTNLPERIHFSYRRYLANRLRSQFGFEGSPLKLEFKARK